MSQEEWKEKWKEMKTTADGSERASVELGQLTTLWFNTGTLCNLECANCYIESSPKNDRLVYLTEEDVIPYLDELETMQSPAKLVGLTGGEPFLNPHITNILEAILARGLEALVLTNATRVIKRHEKKLLELKDQYGDALKLRISLDHHTRELHEKERGPDTFERAMEQTKKLFDQGFDISIASRSLADESAQAAKEGHRKLLSDRGIDIDLDEKLVVFPEMKSKKDLPEITTACWDILGKKPEQQMCASERMIVKRKGESKAVVMPCTLLAYDDQFVLGDSLTKAQKKVYLNHKFCAEFCVLGGASCSSVK